MSGYMTMKKKTSIYQNNKINMEDYEGIRYPDLDTKRAVIDKMLADKLNEVFRILDELQEQIDEMDKHICKHTSWMKMGDIYYCSDCKNSFVPEQDQELEMFAGDKKGLGHICKPLSNLPDQEKLEDRECKACKWLSNPNNVYPPRLCNKHNKEAVKHIEDRECGCKWNAKKGEVDINSECIVHGGKNPEKLEDRECKCDEKPGWDRSVCNFHKNKHIETEV